MKKQIKLLFVLIITVMLLVMQMPIIVLANATDEMINNFKKNNSDKKAEYKNGQAIIMYKKNECSVQSNSIFEDVKIEDSVNFTNANIKKSSKSVNKSVNKSIQDITVSLVSSEKYSTEDLISKLKENSNVMYVSKNYKVKTSSITDEPYEQYQWAIENNGQNSGYENLDINPIKSSDSTEKVIAIVDSGVDYTHSDLDEIMWENPYQSKGLKGQYGYNFAYNTEDPMDDNGHGTHCAGIIAGESDNKYGITGALLGAENVKIMALKFLDSDGSGYSYDAIRAYSYIYQAQLLGTNIVAVNNSWGGYSDEIDEVLTKVINMVGEKGALSICAAGNDGMEITSYEEDWNFVSPACLNSEYIVTVGASTERDELATFSNYGDEVDISAPGTNILSTVSYNVFNPSIYTAQQKENLCSACYDFENGSVKDFECKVTEGTEIVGSGTSFGANETLSLEWDINNADPSKTYNLVIPINIENAKQYYSMMFNTSGDYDAGGYFVFRPIDTSYDEIENLDIFELPEDPWDFFEVTEEYYYISSMNSINYWDHLYGQVGNSVNTNNGALLLQFKPYDTGYFHFNIDDFAISKPDVDEDSFGKYDFYNGTSMATPFVTAAVATTSNLYKGETILQTKSRILNGARDFDYMSWFGTQTVGTLDLSNLENVNPNIDSITIDKNGKVEIKGTFFGDNPTLYITEDIDSEEPIYNEVNSAVYNKEESCFTVTDKNLKNKKVIFKVERSENGEICEKYKFLKYGNEMSKESFNITNARTDIITDGESLYYIDNYSQLIKTTANGNKTILDEGRNK